MPGNLELEVALLEAEQELAELEAGYAVAGKRRPTLPELTARVRFAELDRDVLDTAGNLERRAATIRDQLIDDLATLATDPALLDDPARSVARLRELGSPLAGTAFPDLTALVDEVAAQLEEDLTLAARRGAAEAVEEARRQGLTNLPAVDLTDEDLLTIRTTARRVAMQPVRQGLEVAVDAAERLLPGAEDGAEVLFGALDAVESSSTAGLADVTRQAAAGAQATGRTRAARRIDRPAKVYASELLDGSTCGPCGTVDGRLYRTLEDALADYPGAGGFVFCDGGLRCRGTLVYVWDSEADPTVDDTGPAQGPSDPPGGPDGPIRPLPPDDRTSFPRRAPVVDVPVDLPLPAAPLPPATPSAADPVTVPVDPALEQLGDERLDGAYKAALRDGDRDLAIRYADELDRRGALGSAWRDPDAEDWGDVGDGLPDLTPDELRELEAKTAAAIDDAGGLDALEAAFELDKRPGRRIDKVREDYNAEQYRRMMEAEHVSGFRNPTVAAEFYAKYGDGAGASERLWFGPAREGFYYASEELVLYWQANGRQSFAEYAVSRGIRDRKTLERAKAAEAAFSEGLARAQEYDTARSAERKRQRQADSRKRRNNSAGADLERQRKRLAREAARAERLQRQANRALPADAPARRLLDDGFQT